ncbi:MAG: helix-turn-helix domain-containing protein [Solirubrobacterales bacterium]
MSSAPGLIEGLRERRGELERATLARVYGVSDPASVDDPTYVVGLRQTVAAAIAYALSALTQRQCPQPPPQLFAQARHAARSGVALNTVLRRYVAGHALFADFLIGEAERSDGAVAGSELRKALRVEAALFDNLIDTVAAEYAEELEGRSRGTDQQRLELVRALLDGEIADTSRLRYELDAWHLALLATGPGARESLCRLAVALDRQVLHVRPDSATAWAWFGGRHPLGTDQVARFAAEHLPGTVTLALGEPGRGFPGWHLSHRQARAALPVAIQSPERVVRYADVTLLASALSDDVMASSLEELYLLPLAQEHDGGEALRQTLRAYFRAGRNVSSAAAALGISWPTVKARLDTIEERIGRPLSACTAEVETALRLQRLEPAPSLRSAKP